MKTCQARARRALAVAALVGGLFISACAAWLGAAETPAQDAFRAMAKYVYVAVPAETYAVSAEAEPSVLAAVCDLDRSVHDAFREVRATRLAGGDTLTAALAGAASALSSFSLGVIGQADPSFDPGGIAGRAVIWARVGARSAARMRAWRKTYVQPKLAGFAADGRDPDPDEWAEIDSAVDRTHAAIQAACAT